AWARPAAIASARDRIVRGARAAPALATSFTSRPPLPSCAWPLRRGAWLPWRPRRCGGLPRRVRPCGPRPCARRAGSRGDLPLGLEDDHGAVEGLGELEEVRGGGVAGAALDLDHEGAGEAG